MVQAAPLILDTVNLDRNDYIMEAYGMAACFSETADRVTIGWGKKSYQVTVTGHVTEVTTKSGFFPIV
jgi:hypothetical protein